MTQCEVCGRNLKTGRKYCFEHRGTIGEGDFKKRKSYNRAANAACGVGFLGLGFGGFLYLVSPDKTPGIILFIIGLLMFIRGIYENLTIEKRMHLDRLEAQREKAEWTKGFHTNAPSKFNMPKARVVLMVVFTVAFLFMAYSVINNKTPTKTTNEVGSTASYCPEIRNNPTMTIVEEHSFNSKDAAIKWSKGQDATTQAMVTRIGASGLVPVGQTLSDAYGPPFVVFEIVSTTSVGTRTGFVICNRNGILDDNVA